MGPLQTIGVRLPYFFLEHFNIMGHNLKNVRNGKSESKMAKFEAPGLKE